MDLKALRAAVQAEIQHLMSGASEETHKLAHEAWAKLEQVGTAVKEEVKKVEAKAAGVIMKPYPPATPAATPPAVTTDPTAKPADPPADAPK